MKHLLLTIFLGSLFNPPVQALEILEGPVSKFVDGDTILIGGENIRMKGIDAPEFSQSCKNESGKGYACGKESLNALKQLVGNSTVRCEFTERGTYGRPLSTCFIGNRDLNREMVLNGHAVAFIKYGNTYLAEENTAKQNRSGIWAGEFIRPVEYRAQKWADTSDAPDPNCLIKGNINRDGVRIYHTPWSSPHYKRTKINAKKGERWFCTEGAARQAGWRAPYR